MKWKNIKTEEPNINKIHYLTIIKYNNEYLYSFTYYDGEKWYPKNGIPILFTEDKPEDIILGIKENKKQ